MKIIFVRHGDAVNAKGHFHGQTDEPLTESGKKEAVEISNTVKKLGVNKIISSPLKRAYQTAEIICDKLKLSPFTKNNALIAWDLGNFIGQPHAKCLAQVKHYIEHPNLKVPGGEAFSRFADRVITFLDSHKTDNGLLLVTHGRNILVAEAWCKSGRKGNKYDSSVLLKAHDTTQHGGYALMDDNGFKIVDAEKVAGGRS